MKSILKITKTTRKKVINRSLPDIDSDFADYQRGRVFKYIMDKYGEDYFAQVGTYTNLKSKSSLQELNRYYKELKYSDIAYLSKMIENGDISQIFEKASENKKLKDFIKKAPYIINDIILVEGSIKTSSVHACATIIFPEVHEEGKKLTMYDMVPLKKLKDGTIVTEWEGNFLEKAGFLKLDLLSTKLMGIFNIIINSIEDRTGKRLKIEDIPTDDKEVFEYFKKGWLQNVFQFGTESAVPYILKMQPDTVGDLSAATSLLRPGPMGSGAHMKYVKYKNSPDQIKEIYPKTKEILGETFNLLVYQEQILFIFNKIAGFDLVTSDIIRKALGKKDRELLESYEKKFIHGCCTVSNYSIEDAKKLWQDIDSFAEYSFNRSHSQAYANEGYDCNWFKLHYPFDFWSASLKYATEKEIPYFTSEIKKIGNIKIMPPDINVSKHDFYFDIENEKIYWNLYKIKFVGENISQSIIEERENNGLFFDIKEFTERLGWKKVGKRVMHNLIFSGCFDELYGVDDNSLWKRFSAIKDYYKLRRERGGSYKEDQIPEEFTTNKISENYYWSIKQWECSGLDTLNLPEIMKNEDSLDERTKFLSSEELLSENIVEEKEEVLDEEGNDLIYEEDDSDLKYVGEYVYVAGIVKEVVKKQQKNKNGNFVFIKLISGTNEIQVKLWSDVVDNEKLYKPNKQIVKAAKELTECEGKILIIKGKVDPPNIFNRNKSLTFTQSIAKNKNSYKIF